MMPLSRAVVVLVACPATVMAQGGLPALRNDAAPRILLLGTFHFQDAGRDAYRPVVPFDVRSRGRQQEIENLLAKLAAWRPTRIAVEARPERQARLDSLFAIYPGNGMDTLRNEIYQIGFRLAKRLGLPGVNGVDAPARSLDSTMTDEEWQRRSQALRRGLLSSTDWEARFTALYRGDDSLKALQPLEETLLYMNSPERLRAGHGHYLVGNLLNGAPGEYVGADGFVSAWYNRNIRIYSNIVRLARDPEERILVLFGAGHIPILRELMQSTPVLRVEDLRVVLR